MGRPETWRCRRRCFDVAEFLGLRPERGSSGPRASSHGRGCVIGRHRRAQLLERSARGRRASYCKAPLGLRSSTPAISVGSVAEDESAAAETPPASRGIAAWRCRRAARRSRHLERAPAAGRAGGGRRKPTRNAATASRAGSRRAAPRNRQARSAASRRSRPGAACRSAPASPACAAQLRHRLLARSVSPPARFRRPRGLASMRPFPPRCLLRARAGPPPRLALAARGAASASNFSAACRALRDDGGDRAEQEPRSSQIRTRTLTVCSASVHQSRCISIERTDWRTAAAAR